MKSHKYSVIMCALGLLVSAAVQAQDQPRQGGEGRRGKAGEAGEAKGRGQMMNPDARVEALDRVLKLSDDQKAKVKDIYAKSQDEMRSMMREGGRDQQGNREKMVELMRSTRDQVRALLTDEQKKKFDEMPQPGAGDQRGRGKERRGGKDR